jgi:hypothetical protein
VFPLFKIGRYLVVAYETVVRLKKIPGPFRYFLRTRVTGLLLDVLMAILAGRLAVDRGVEFFGVDPPGGMSWDRTPPEEWNKDRECDEPSESSASAVDVAQNSIHYPQWVSLLLTLLRTKKQNGKLGARLQ